MIDMSPSEEEIEQMVGEISDCLDDLSDEQVIAMHKAMVDNQPKAGDM